MAGRIYSAHATVALGAGGAATYEARIAAPATNTIELTDIIVAGDFASATDEPILVELLTASAASSGTTATPTIHNGESALASGATVALDGVTATPTSNTVVFAQYVKPGFSFRPGVTIEPSGIRVIRMTPGAQARNVTLSLYWRE